MKTKKNKQKASVRVTATGNRVNVKITSCVSRRTPKPKRCGSNLKKAHVNNNKTETCRPKFEKIRALRKRCAGNNMPGSKRVMHFERQMRLKAKSHKRIPGLLLKNRKFEKVNWNGTRINRKLRTRCHKTLTPCTGIFDESLELFLWVREKLTGSHETSVSCLKNPEPCRKNLLEYLEKVGSYLENLGLYYENVKQCRANAGPNRRIVSQVPAFRMSSLKTFMVNPDFMMTIPLMVCSSREFLGMIDKILDVCRDLSGPCCASVNMNPAIPGIHHTSPDMVRDVSDTWQDLFGVDREFFSTWHEIFGTGPERLRSWNESFETDHDFLEAWRSNFGPGRDISGLWSHNLGTGRDFVDAWPENFGLGRDLPDVWQADF